MYVITIAARFFNSSDQWGTRYVLILSAQHTLFLCRNEIMRIKNCLHAQECGLEDEGHVLYAACGECNQDM